MDGSVALNEELKKIYDSDNAGIDKYFNTQGYNIDFENIFSGNNDEDKKTKLKLIYILHNEPL